MPLDRSGAAIVKETNIDTRMMLVVLVIASSVGLIGCGPRSTPPAPDSCFSVTADGASFTFLKWRQGLAIMFVDRMGGHTAGGSGSTHNSIHQHRGTAGSDDATGYDWELTTEDGRTATLKIDDVTYDLSEGTVFAIQVSGEQVTVHQLDNDLSGLNNRIDDCTVFLRDNPEVIQRITPSVTED